LMGVWQWRKGKWWIQSPIKCLFIVHKEQPVQASHPRMGNQEAIKDSCLKMTSSITMV